MVQRVYYQRKSAQVDKVENSWLEGWTSNYLHEQQMLDTDVAKIIQFKEDNLEKPAWSMVSAEGKRLKCLWAQWDRLHLKQDVLYRRWETPDGLQIKWQLVLPNHMVKEVMPYLHDAPTSAHLGVNRTLASIRSRFYWPQYHTDVKQWVKQCDQCAARKPSKNQRKARLGQYRVGEPMERIAIDILGPLPKSSDGNKYIMIVADYFTKWAEAYAIPNQEAVTIASKLVNEFITRFGVPRQIHTDQGRSFESKLFKAVCELLDVEKTRTTAFHPQSDGLVERLNRTLENMLSLYVEENQLDWDVYLSLMMMAYRSTPQGSSLYSPNFLMFGREIELPIDLLIGRPPIDESDYGDENDYAAELRFKLESAYEYARYNLKKSADRQKKNYDHRSDHDLLPVGQAVWLYTPTKKKGISPKLQKVWKGPFVITDKLSDLVYRIQLTARSKPMIVHRDRLYRYYGRDPPTWFQVKETMIPETENATELGTEYESTSDHDESEVNLDIDPNVNVESDTGMLVVSDEIEEQENLPVPSTSDSETTTYKTQTRTRQNIKPPKRFGEWVT